MPWPLRAKLVLVRHGQTDWNLEGRYQGGSDVPLNATGREQAERLAMELSASRYEAVYSSPLRRSLDTARAIAQGRGLEVYLDPRLKEIDLGEWEGMLATHIAAEYPELYRQWEKDPRLVRPPGGESIREVHDRAVAAVEEMVSKHPGGTLCLVTHKTAMVVIRSHYLGLDLREEMGKMPPNARWEVVEIAVSTSGAPGSGNPCCSVMVRE